jgi:hypothetical protein
MPPRRAALHGGRKAEIFPAISAFSAFDRLWGMFFYFVKNESESPQENAQNAKRQTFARGTRGLIGAS